MSIDVTSLAAAGRAAFVPEYDPEQTVPKPPPPRLLPPEAKPQAPEFTRAFAFTKALEPAEPEPLEGVLAGAGPDPWDPPCMLLQVAPTYAGGNLPDGVWQRLPLGAAGTLLTSDGNSMGWALAGGASGALQPSGDVTGARDTAAITAALAASNDVTLGPGTFYINSGNIVQPAHSVVQGSGPLTRIFALGSGDAWQLGGGVKPVGFSNIPGVSLAGRLANLTIDGTNTSSTTPSTGLHLGSGIGFSLDDVFITNFAGTPNSIGYHFDNNFNTGAVSPWYTEKMHARIYSANNGIHVMIDAAGATQPSFEYDDFESYLLWVAAFQMGVLVKDGAYMAGGSVKIRGNFDTNNQLVNGVISAGSNGGILANIATWTSPSAGVLAMTGQPAGLPPGLAYVATGSLTGIISYTGSTNAQLSGCQYIGGTGAASTVATGGGVQNAGGCLAIVSQQVTANNVSFLQDVTLDIGVEANNGKSNGPNTVFFGQNQTGGGNSPNQLINCSGRMAFRLGPWTQSNGATGGQVSLAGPIRNDAALASVNTQIVNGNLDVATPGQGLQVKEGSNCKQGTAVLSGGSVVVANTSVTASSRILVTSNADGGTPGWLRVSARTAGTSFTITSSSGTDTSTVAYQIFEPG